MPLDFEGPKAKRTRELARELVSALAYNDLTLYRHTLNATVNEIVGPDADPEIRRQAYYLADAFALHGANAIWAAAGLLGKLSGLTDEETQEGRERLTATVLRMVIDRELSLGG